MTRQIVTVTVTPANSTDLHVMRKPVQKQEELNQLANSNQHAIYFWGDSNQEPSCSIQLSITEPVKLIS